MPTTVQPKRKSPAKRRPVRRSISLPYEVDEKIKTIAQHQKSSANRVLEGLIEAGLAAKEDEKRRFFEAAERFRTANEPAEIEHAKQELSHLIFGA